jgi:hypothetical protein
MFPMMLLTVLIWVQGLKITCQNIQHVLPKLDEIKYNIGNMKDEFKPHILGMCETFLNEEKSRVGSWTN